MGDGGISACASVPHPLSLTRHTPPLSHLGVGSVRSGTRRVAEKTEPRSFAIEGEKKKRFSF